MTVVTRFAPSPTGFLHIGGARTALFNWLFARHHGGRFLLRIEDTDRARSSEEAVEAIFSGLKWLGLDWDGDAVSQFSRVSAHVDTARRLLDEGKAYRCYCSPDELSEMRARARSEGRSMRYDGRWRDRDPSEAPEGVSPVIRLKSPQQGETVINDLVQGEVRIANDQLDDMVLLRSDGTPTYMLAVVVDDHDAGVSHVIRGDDHLTNAFRQSHIYQAMNWTMPEFAHIPLIHGADGAKLSKRHGALNVEAYREMGFLSDALCNYLLRLGWGHGDDEIISMDQAIEWFDLDGVGRSSARFDIDKLTNLNGHYIRRSDDADLVAMILPMLERRLGSDISGDAEERLSKAMPGIKERAKTIVELSDMAEFYVCNRPLKMNEKAARILNQESLEYLRRFHDIINGIDDWVAANIESSVRAVAEAEGVKLGKIAQPLRAALTGSNVSPGIFEVMEILGREQTVGRICDVLENSSEGVKS